ncbi:MAG: isoprenyl transferase [Candidatus Hydrogenedentes bacterium]|nr:isoprenyl transferase [Candidatus Hydrogenedentota bacterium]
MLEGLPEIDRARLPRHVAVIMDGNGRWAQRERVSRAAGHEAGAKSVRAIVEACRELERIEVLSLYAFSTENWRRSKLEVSALFRLLSKYVKIELENIHKENIRISIMGRMEGLPARAVADLRHCMDLTRNNTAMVLNVAINYGGRAEIADAAKRIAQDAAAGRLKPDAVDEATFAKYLYVPQLPDPDLLIRTSGELRLSNFMLWQMSYAEIVVAPTLWPDFRKPHLYAAIHEYQARQRRFGGR